MLHSPPASLASVPIGRSGLRKTRPDGFTLRKNRFGTSDGLIDGSLACQLFHRTEIFCRFMQSRHRILAPLIRAARRAF